MRDLRAPTRWLLVVAVHAWALAALWQNQPALPTQAPTPLQVRMLAAEEPSPQRRPVHTVRPLPPTPRPQANSQAQPIAVPPAPTSRLMTSSAASAAEASSTTPPAAAPATASAAAALVSPSSPSSPASLSPPRVDADYLDNPKPAYPALSRRLGEQGKVLLRVRVAADGNVQEVQVHSASEFPRLDKAALDAVRRWKFLPARQGDQAVAASVNVPIVFSLKD